MVEVRRELESVREQLSEARDDISKKEAQITELTLAVETSHSVVAELQVCACLSTCMAVKSFRLTNWMRGAVNMC